MRIQKKFMITAFLLSVMVFAGACGSRRQGTIMQGRMGSASTLQQKEEVLTEEEESTQEQENQGDLSGIYLLKQIDTANKTVYLMKAGNGRQVQYGFTTTTLFLDKYGNSKSQTSFLSGEAVEIQTDSKTEELKKLWITDRVWVQDEITNYSVAPDSHAITIGKTKYSYDGDLPVFSGAEVLGQDMIDSGDEIRVVGMDKKILSLSIMKGHGYLQLVNTEIFDGSFICIGDKIFEEVEPDSKITVPEGTYLVTVANDGYGGSREVTIERNMTVSLNLDELKGEGPKICKITFYVGIEGAVLLIDGKAVDYSQPVEVQYGVHSISVSAEGYDTVRNKLVVNSEEAEIEIGLTKTDTSENQDNSGTNNGDTSGNVNNNVNNNNNTNNTNNTNNNTNNTNNANNGNNNTNTTNNNTNSNNNTNNNNNNNNNNSTSTDYLTTLYNLLTSINESEGTSSSERTALDMLDSYDDLKDQ